MDVLRTFSNSILKKIQKNDLIMEKLSQDCFTLDEVLEIANLLLQECDEYASNLDYDMLLLILKALAKAQPYMNNIYEDIIISENLEVMVDKQDFLNHHYVSECYEPYGNIFLTLSNDFFNDFEDFDFQTILHEKIYEIQETTAKFLKLKNVNDKFQNCIWNSYYRNFVSVKAYQIIMYEKIKFNIPDVVTNSACFTCNPEIL